MELERPMKVWTEKTSKLARKKNNCANIRIIKLIVLGHHTTSSSSSVYPSRALYCSRRRFFSTSKRYT